VDIFGEVFQQLIARQACEKARPIHFRRISI